MVSGTQALGLVRIGRVLGDAARCRILLCLLEGPHYPSELAMHLGLSKSNVSNHLGCLRGCGLVTVRQEGRRSRYQFTDGSLAEALRGLVVAAARLPERCETREHRAS